MKNFTKILKTLLLLTIATFCLSLSASPKVAISNYPFRKGTLVKMLEEIKDSGVKNIFAFQGMKIGGKGKNASKAFSASMSDEALAEMQAILAQYDSKIVGIGHIKVKDEAGIEDIFKFCKKAGIEIMTIEAPVESLKIYDEMSAKYGVKGGLYNHPQATAPYCTPEKALAGIEGLKEIKVFTDIGQWARANVNIIKALEKITPERVMAVSLQDLSPKGGICEVFGKGTLPLKEYVDKMNASGFNGYYLVMFGNAKDRSQMEKVLPSVEYLKTIMEF